MLRSHNTLRFEQENTQLNSKAHVESFWPVLDLLVVAIGFLGWANILKNIVIISETFRGRVFGFVPLECVNL